MSGSSLSGYIDSVATAWNGVQSVFTLTKSNLEDDIYFCDTTLRPGTYGVTNRYPPQLGQTCAFKVDVCLICENTSKVYQALIGLDAAQIRAISPTQADLDRLAPSVIAHELGHVLQLADRFVSTYPSGCNGYQTIMVTGDPVSRSKCLTAPTPCDGLQVATAYVSGRPQAGCDRCSINAPSCN